MTICVNNVKVNAVVDIGANCTIFSREAARAIGLSVRQDDAPTHFKHSGGGSGGYDGHAVDVTFTLHPMLEFDVDRVKVS